MRKNINKLIAFAIGISVISGGAMPAFAADTTISSTSTSAAANTDNSIYVQNQVKQNPVLTLKEAVNSAINNSEKLALQAKQIKLYEDKMDIQEELDDVNDNDEDFPYDKLELLLNQSKEQKEYMKDQIEQDITNKYNTLIDKEKALNKLKKQIQIKTKQINDTGLKKNLGLVTSIDVKNAEIELEKLKNTEKAKEDQLKNSQDYFEVLTGKDLSKYSLDESQEFEAFRITGSVDQYFDGVIDKYKKYDKKLLELTKDNLKDIKDTAGDKPDTSDAPNKNSSAYYDTDPDTGEKEFNSDKYDKAVLAYKNQWNTYGGYLEQKFAYSTSVYTLNETTKGLKNGLKESYASLLDMENSIKVMKSTMEVKNKELANSKLKYDLGLITKTDYNSLILDNDDLETNLRTAINNYNTLKEQIQKPWISASGAGSAGGAS
ncbi:outer membrane efflux protein [Clostridium puniceum]|uniref:Outer membrane efflux protein n=1 Tax=Clostridium puniceum TaxID=29367 RepID=A0A1S8TXG9_9CLOT|nr:TolC family protein [Clostridium puniceum]OOM82431.1 outer membrane efflux protein [Clostridium puniceum]